MGAPMKEQRVIRREGSPVVDWDLIPDHDRDLMCRELTRTVKELFKDPAVQEDFERWKAERAARREAETCCR